MRVKLKSSKSYPSDLLREENLLRPAEHEEGDNSSSGVSSDQEITITNHADAKLIVDSKKPATVSTSPNSQSLVEAEKPHSQAQAIHQPLLQQHQLIQQRQQKHLQEQNQKQCSDTYENREKYMSQQPVYQKTLSHAESIQIFPPTTIPVLNNLPIKTTVVITDKDDRDDDSPSPPAKGFQRHNSLTRKQANAIAMNRAIHTRTAVSLVKLPPPIELDIESESGPYHHALHHHSSDINKTISRRHYNQQQTPPQQCTEIIVLAPPPQFCDCTNNAAHHNNNKTGDKGSSTTRGVRIVGAVPKVNKILV